MRREQLEHLVRAAGAITGDDELIVIGSQAILGSVRSGLPPEATRSIEADIVPMNDPDERKADLIDGSIGEASLFEETHGIYAQGVSLTAAILPEGWRDRLVPLHNENTGGVTAWCLEPHDLVASKLAAGRPKDVEFARALLAAGIVDRDLLTARIDLLDAPAQIRERAKALIGR
ncbi:DUF6036 family nucleotidyltransferase [Rhabdothermincola sediminis]|uniref:DUF6036 family nucleotidyltransferase n=1 Tax=Rhabdothermincola sediminis TaxID=2751370 RepID=UPI001AA076F1|nr:DUF6036 family nucleotidyltransferase [Rhabdothermincola sediminis]